MQKINSLSKKDKWKLIYAYLLSPMMLFLTFSGSMMSELYGKYGDAGYKTALDISNKISIRLCVLFYLPLTLPAMIIRFAYFRRRLNYGLEIYTSMIISILMSKLIIWGLTDLNISFLSFGLLDIAIVYCILSFQSIGINTLHREYRYIITLLTLLYPFICLGISTNFPIFPIWEAVFLCVIINSHLQSGKEDTSTQTYTVTSSTNIEQPLEVDESKYTATSAPVQHTAPSVPSPMQAEPFIPDDNLVGKLICVGLAHIGRKTKLKNKYITDESEAERYSVERPFLDLLSYKFKDDTKRETLRENFMLFKEAYLFLIYRALLKDNPGMQNKVKTMLRIMLSQNSTQTENNARKEYIELFSKRFSYAHKKTKSTKQSLRYAFWNILAVKYPDWINRDTVADIMNNDYL